MGENLVKRLRVLALEPYAARSHMQFLDGLQRHSAHAIEVESLPARKWKWRMRTAALHYAEWLAAREPADVLFVSDFLNLAELEALLPEEHRPVPVVHYFHENQLTYPLQEHEERDFHFALTHFYSMLCATKSVFNSEYHRTTFLEELPKILRLIPDVDVSPAFSRVAQRTAVLPLGHDVEPRQQLTRTPAEPVILWSHRWEYDKDPDSFVEALLELDRRGEPFRVRLLGESFRTVPQAFETLQTQLSHRLDQVGFVADRGEYLQAVAGADIVVSTAIHEFFGLGTLEALTLGLLPVLPRDLAYPELLPADPQVQEAFLYERASGLTEPLAKALAWVRAGTGRELRGQVTQHAQGFHWRSLAPSYDRLFEEVAAGAT